MNVFRLAKSPFHLDLSGKGAELFGGRWNSKGIPMLYTGQNRSICHAEALVHLSRNIYPLDFWMVEIEIPENLEMDETFKLLEIWSKTIEFLAQPNPKEFGDSFIKERGNNNLFFLG
jgi:RES domain-containing protein